jgi:hypothetical protein
MEGVNATALPAGFAADFNRLLSAAPVGGLGRADQAAIRRHSGKFMKMKGQRKHINSQL